MKCSAVVATLNDSAKIILCLDISCEQFNIPFDEPAGIRLAGIRKTSYKNNRKNLIKLLNLNKKLGIAELTLKMGINSSNVEKTANRIYEAYKKESFDADLDHPQFIAMSCYQACKLEKFKVTKKPFIAASNLKPNQWNQLEKSWDKWTVNVGKSENMKKSTEDPQEESAGKKLNLKRKHTAEPETEDYDVWAKRTLEKAQKNLEIQELQKELC